MTATGGSWAERHTLREAVLISEGCSASRCPDVGTGFVGEHSRYRGLWEIRWAGQVHLDQEGYAC